MAACVLDTSAVVKLYVAEVGSAWLRSFVNPAAGNPCYLAAITRVEVVAALYKRVRTSSLTVLGALRAQRAFRQDLRARFRRIRVKNAILDQAMILATTYLLRAYDAVQLASALSFQSDLFAHGQPGLVFVSADHLLNQAAYAEGLIVDDPNNHP